MVFMCLIPSWGRDLFGPSNDIVMKGFGIVLISALIRPVAAWILGGIGDKVGRKYALLISGGIMTISCIVMSVLPSHDEVNFITKYGLTTALIVACRILQIASVSGKLNGLAIFLIEHFPKRAGLISGVIWGSTILGMFLAALVESQKGLGWRLPIFIGGIAAFISFVVQYFLNDGSEFTKPTTVETPRRVPKFVAFCIGSAIGGMFYYCISYIPISLQMAQPTFNIGWYKCMSLLIYGLATIVSGLTIDGDTKIRIFLEYVARCLVFWAMRDMREQFLDRGGTANQLTLSLGFLLQLLVCIRIPSSLLFPKSIPALWRVTGIGIIGTTIIPIAYTIIPDAIILHPLLMLSLGLFVGPSHRLLYDLFPPQHRYKSTSFYYGLGTAIFGGSAGYICMQLQRISPALPLFFILTCSILGGTGLILSYKIRPTHAN